MICYLSKLNYLWRNASWFEVYLTKLPTTNWRILSIVGSRHLNQIRSDTCCQIKLNFAKAIKVTFFRRFFIAADQILKICYEIIGSVHQSWGTDFTPKLKNLTGFMISSEKRHLYCVLAFAKNRPNVYLCWIK